MPDVPTWEDLGFDLEGLDAWYGARGWARGVSLAIFALSYSTGWMPRDDG